MIVAEEASFSRAAQILGVKQSAVSRRIQALEDELGVSLFERQQNGVKLTFAGRRFLSRARSALADIDSAMKSAAAAGRGAEGELGIGVLPSSFPAFLDELLTEFRAAHSGVAVNLHDDSPRRLRARLMERRLDLAFVNEETPTPGCDAEVWRSGGVRVALEEGHPLAGCELIDWQLLKDEHFLFGRQATASCLDARSREAVAELGGALSFSVLDASLGLTMKLVALGFGLSLVSDCSADVPYPGVVFRQLSGEALQGAELGLTAVNRLPKA